MRAPYPLLYAFIVVPEVVRDAVYDFVARNRYRCVVQIMSHEADFVARCKVNSVVLSALLLMAPCRWLGKSDQCHRPSEQMRRRFIG